MRMRAINVTAALVGAALMTVPAAWSEDPPVADWAVSDQGPLAVSFPTTPLAFVGIVPCRMADTRDATLPPGFGPPALGAGSPRNFVLTGRCGIPTNALAVSANVTVVNPPGVGFLLIRPVDGPNVVVSTLNFIPGQTVANGANIPLGTGGAALFLAGVTATELIIDVNGYYLDAVGVKTVNALSGDVTLAPGSNVTITPSGNTLTIAAASGGGGDITGVTAGTGLTGGGASGDVTLGVNLNTVQARVTQTCPTGQSVRAVNGDGTVACQAAVTSVGTGVGLTGGPITSSGTLAVNFAGTGAAATASRSDHNHLGQSWSGVASRGLSVTAGGASSWGIDAYGDQVGLRGTSQVATGSSYGAIGISSSTSGFGVYGQATATSGVNYGVFGTTASPTGYAGYFSGPLRVTADLTVDGQLTTFATATIAATGDGISNSTALINKRFCALTRMNQVGTVNPGTNFSCLISKSGSTFTLTARASSASHTVTCDMACF